MGEPMRIVQADGATDPLGEAVSSPLANTLHARVKSLVDAMGEVQASPTANTLLDRLKAIATALAGTVLAAGTALIGSVAAAPATGVVYSGVTPLTPKFAKISAASSGNNTLIAAVTSKKIRVLAAVLVGIDVVTAKFQDGASGTDLTGAMPVGSAIATDTQPNSVVLPFNPAGWFEGTAATLLNLNLSAAKQVSGCITYVEV